MMFLPLFPGLLQGLDRSCAAVLLCVQRGVRTHFCPGILEQNTQSLCVSSLRGEAKSGSKITLQRKHVLFFFFFNQSKQLHYMGNRLGPILFNQHQKHLISFQKGIDWEMLQIKMEMRFLLQTDTDIILVPSSESAWEVHCSCLRKGCCCQWWRQICQLYWLFPFDKKSTFVSENMLKYL